MEVLLFQYFPVISINFNPNCSVLQNFSSIPNRIRYKIVIFLLTQVEYCVTIWLQIATKEYNYG